MKILHVATGFDVDFPGGITNYVRTLAASQTAAGDDVHVVDSSERHRTHESGFTVHPHRSNLTMFVASTKKDPQGTRALLQTIRDVGPDVIHYHLTIGLGIDFYAGIQQQASFPYVVSLHDYYLTCPRITLIDYTGTTCGGPAPAKCNKCVGLLEQSDFLYKASRKTGLPLPRVPARATERRNAVLSQFLCGAAAVLPVSERVREIFASLHPTARYHVEHIGSASALQARPERTPSPNIRATFMGVLSTHKGAGLLVDLARRVQRPDLEFHVYGRVEEPWGRRARAAGVELHGAYKPADLPTIIAGTDVGLALPVWEDNGPQVVMEFINLGVPVLGTRMGGIPDFVTPDTGFLFDPSPAGLDQAVRFLETLRREEPRFGEIQRLTTPQDHATAVARHYAFATAEHPLK